MTFWILLIAAILIGIVWWQYRGNDKENTNVTNTSGRLNNKNDVHYHQTHLATEASEELTPHDLGGSNNKDDVYYHQTHLSKESSTAPTPLNQGGSNNNNDVYYHQTHLSKGSSADQTSAQTVATPSSNAVQPNMNQQAQRQVEPQQEQSK